MIFFGQNPPRVVSSKATEGANPSLSRRHLPTSPPSPRRPLRPRPAKPGSAGDGGGGDLSAEPLARRHGGRRPSGGWSSLAAARRLCSPVLLWPGLAGARGGGWWCCGPALWLGPGMPGRRPRAVWTTSSSRWAAAVVRALRFSRPRGRHGCGGRRCR
jgi:hypothetical protein